MRKRIKEAAQILGLLVDLVIGIANAIQLLRGDSSAATIATAIVCALILLLALAYVAFSRSESQTVPTRRVALYPRLYKPARILFWVCIVTFVLLAILLLIWPPSKRPGEISIVVAQFHGPLGESYRVTEHLMRALEASAKGDASIRVRGLSRTITPQEGSEVAREVGRSENADFVIWGWYGPTQSDVVIDVHLERLSSPDSPIQPRQGVFTFYDASTEFNSFRLQQRLSNITSASVLFIVGNVRYDQHDYAKALGLLDGVQENVLAEQALGLSPSASLIYLRANCLMFMRRTKEAIHEYDKFVKVDSARAAMYNNRASCYFEIGSFDRAIKDLDRAIAIEPKYPLPYNNRACVLMKLGDNTRALRDVSMYLELKPHDPLALSNRAAAYSSLKRFAEARADIFEAHRLLPNNQTLLVNMGACYLNQGYPDSALVTFNEALRRGSPNAELLLNRGKAYSALGDNARAIVDFNKALELDSTLVEAYENRGVAYQKSGRERNAIQDFTNYMRRGGSHPLVFHNRGVAYFRVRVLDSALLDFNAAIDRNPSYQSAYSNRAELLLSIGKIRPAIDDYTKVLSFDSTDAHAYRQRGVAHLMLGHTQGGLADLGTAIRLNPEDGLAYLNRGIAYFDRGDLRRATDDFKKTRQLMKDSLATAVANEYLLKINRIH